MSSKVSAEAFAETSAAVLRGFRARLDGPVVFVGDSIAEELAHYLQSRVGLKDVSWCTKRGAMPVDIGSQLRQWLVDPHNNQLLTNAGLLIVCAGTNLAHATPSLIPEEVNKHLITPLQKLCAGHKILVGPLTREYVNYTGAGAGSGDRGGGSSASRRSESLASLLHHSNLELQRCSLDGGFGFVNLFGGRLSVDDFRDNLHLKDEGYLKMLSAVLEVAVVAGAPTEVKVAAGAADAEAAPGAKEAEIDPAELQFERDLKHLEWMHPSADFKDIRSFRIGDDPFVIKGTWSSDAVNTRVPPFHSWLREGELDKTSLGAIVYYGEVEGVLAPIHAALESEVLRDNGLAGEWGLYPCCPHDR